MRYDAHIKKLTRKDGMLYAVVEIDGNFKPEENSGFCFMLVDDKLMTIRQNSQFHAICKDWGIHVGHDIEGAKDEIKSLLDFDSWSEQTRESASEIIEATLRLCVAHEIPLQGKTMFEMDADKRVYFCEQARICLVCGDTADIHHVDRIGMGSDRDKVDDSKYKKVPLCRKHHSEIHTSGEEKFIKDNILEDFRGFLCR